MSATVQIPVGGIISWAKSLGGAPQTLPYGWVECNGQTLSDPRSVFNGQTMPDLNTSQRFLRGSSASGGVGGSESHTHSVDNEFNTTTVDPFIGGTEVPTVQMNLFPSANHPPFYEVVFIIKVK
jgi:hypothetical protein